MKKHQRRLSFNQYKIRGLYRILKKVNAWQDPMRHCTDEALQGKTAQFQKRLANGEKLDDLLPEAFATIREAAYRLLGMFAYDEQILGGIVLHQGKVAEMLTGEGKTLTAIFPMYLNALTGKGAMLVTANDYLAVRDAEEMGPVYRWLGLTTAIGVKKSRREMDFTVDQKKEIYYSDIIYTTYSTLGFDYLMENLASEKQKQYMRPFHYVIIDEIDSVLLDSAQMPLIISGAPRVQSNLYPIADQFVRMLVADEDYEVDEDQSAAWLTPQGIKKAERYFQITNLYAEEYSELNRHLLLALKAHTLFEENRHYLIEKAEVTLLNENSGRSLPGTRLQAGLHQAIETKESVKLSEEKRAMASITYQNLFKKFEKMSGMSGTVKVSEQEFNEIYGLEVLALPPHRPVQRIDFPDKIYPTLEEKMVAALDLIEREAKTGRPLLIAVGSVGMSRIYSQMLLQKGIAHNVLNAYHVAKEAEIVKMAGQKGAVTIATPMAGRGTDIKLGPGVKELGGLLVIATEKMISERVDLQLRGRAGRQGDPGGSIFYSSLEDELMKKWGMQDQSESPRPRRKWRSLFQRNPYQGRLDQAQTASDSHAKEIREQAMYLDESLALQRDIIYRQRDQFLDEQYLVTESFLMALAKQVVDQFLTDYDHSLKRLLGFIATRLTYQRCDIPATLDMEDNQSVNDYLLDLYHQELERKKRQFPTDEEYQDFVKKALLKAIDTGWIEQVDYLQQLKQVIGTRQLAQRNIFYEYHREALESYRWMKDDIYVNAVRFLCLSYIDKNAKGETVVHFA